MLGTQRGDVPLGGKGGVPSEGFACRQGQGKGGVPSEGLACRRLQGKQYTLLSMVHKQHRRSTLRKHKQEGQRRSMSNEAENTVRMHARARHTRQENAGAR
eukprot:scaffold28651_cov19-Tisochrysis_lutea.AAC.1